MKQRKRSAELRFDRKAKGLCITCFKQPINYLRSDLRCTNCLDKQKNA